MPLTPGSRLGPYEILSPLGAGGMGEVYKARDSKLNRDVAIKVLPESVAHDAERLARFQREAQVLAALNHPNIAAIYGVEQNALVMELADGETLSGPLPVDEAIAIAQQIADALEYAHEKGIIHRDLKPANINVTPSGQVKVLDFGLAKAMAEDPQSQAFGTSPTLSLAATKMGMILGTAGYMSPEQAKGVAVDKRADIWAFGAVLFELLAGKRLIDEPTATEALAAVLKSDLELAALPAATPPRIRRLIERCLQRDPKQRLRDIGEARIVLNSPEDRAAAPIAAKETARLWIAATALLALAFAALSLIHFRELPPEAPVGRFFVDPPDEHSYMDVALSPDGRKLVFVARGQDGKPGLWIRPIDSLAAVPLPGTDQARSPFWSPDSKTIAFFAGGKLKRIEASGGPAITLSSSTSRAAGSWSREGVILFEPPEPGPLHRVSAAGGVSSAATLLESKENVRHSRPWFLPDGDHFLYVVRTPKSKVRVASLRSGGADAKDVMEITGNVAYAEGRLLFMRESTLMAQPFDLRHFALAGEAVPVAERILLSTNDSGYFSVSENGLLAYLTAGDETGAQLAWVDRSGKLLEKIGEPGALGRLNMSLNGKIAAVSVLDKTARSYDIWLYDLTRKIGSRFTLDSANSEDSPVVSADGATVVFGSDRKIKGTFDLYRKASDGSGTEELLVADAVGSKVADSFSPDGKFLLYSTVSNSTGLLMALPLGREAKPFAFVTGGYNAQFSPDGHWVLFQATGGGATEIFVAPFPGPGGQRQVSTSNAFLPRWRGDGKELYYVVGGQLMAVEVNAKGSTLEFGKPQPLFAGIRGGSGPSYDVSPDGKRFLVIQSPSVAVGEPLILVQNWPASLRR